MAIGGAVVSLERAVTVRAAQFANYIYRHLVGQAMLLLAASAIALCGISNATAWMAIYLLPALPYLLSGSPRPRKIVALSELASFMPYSLGGLAFLLAGRVDRLLIPALSSVRELGYYMAVATATELTSWATRWINDSRVAKFRNNSVGPTLGKIIVRDLAILTSASVAIAGGIYVALLPALGPAFDDARELIIPLSAAAVTWGTFQAVSARMLGSGRRRQSVAFDGATASLVTVLCVVLVPQEGALGAAWACAGGYAVMTIAGILIAGRSHRDNQ